MTPKFEGYVERLHVNVTGQAVSKGQALFEVYSPELVFGVSSRSGGLGWYIFENRNQLLTANVFAGLLMVIIIGLLVESVIFRTIEKRTVQKWGMQN